VPIRFALILALLGSSALAADLDGVPPYGPRRIVAPPYGPPPALLRRPCPPPAYVTRAPTNALDDPTYVGSAYGLGKPSYYGFVPPLGVDDPYGRPVRAC
jgi:hypothetical protein